MAIMGRVFIDRPVFAIVISLFLVLTGALTALQLPVAQYPQIAPPAVRVSENSGSSGNPTASALSSSIRAEAHIDVDNLERVKFSLG